MHVIVVNLAYEPGELEAEALIERYAILRGWAEGVQAAGVQVSVIQRGRQDWLVERNGVPYRLVADGHGAWLPRWQASRPVTAAALLACSQSADLQVIHLNGLIFPGQARQMGRALPAGSVLAAQHHAERPGDAWRRALGRWGLAGVDGFLFSQRDLAQEWIQAGIIPSHECVHEVMEASTSFGYRERPQSRAITGLQGDPVVLWAGNLKANKDPLTILAGFERVLDELPRARLYMAYREADLLPAVQGRLAASPKLAAAVTLLGTIPADKMESYYNSADLFVQGSYREGSGLAVLEALACGAIPVVTDIPAFRALTAGGQVGALFPPGEAHAFAEAFLRLAGRERQTEAQAARQLFERRWSYRQVGRSACTAYEQIYQRKTGRGLR